MEEQKMKDLFYNEGEGYEPESAPKQEDLPQEELITQEEAVPQEESVPEAESMPQEEPVPEAESMPQEELVPKAETVPQEEPVPQKEPVRQEEPVPQVEAMSQEETVPQLKQGKKSRQKKDRKKKKKSAVRKVMKTICISLLAGIVCGSAFLGTVAAGIHVFGVKEETPVVSEVSTVQGNPSTQLISETVKESIDVSVVADHCMPSIVSINNKGVQEVSSWFGTYEEEVSGSGSGIIIGENETELLIVTNYHVVADSTELSVYFSFDEERAEENLVTAKIKGYDSQKDLAVISVKLNDIPTDAKEKISVASIGDSSKLKVGEQVVAIGNALGYGQSVTTGIVSALNREVTVEGTRGEWITNRLIQTDAAINPGNSGGALINMNGEVIGINSVKFASEEVEGMGYAIPITDVESIIGDLMTKEIREKLDKSESGYLGIECADVTAEASQMYNLPIGIYVKAVKEGSAADSAGIKDGDVIVKLDGNTVANTAELQEGLSYYRAGEIVEITVKTRASGYEEQVMKVILSKAEDAGIR